MGIDPATLSLIATIGSTAVGAVGAISQRNASAAAANYQAQVARNNQQIANQNAAYATAAGETKAYDEALKQRAQAGAIGAALAANGMDVNSGSALDVRETGREFGQTDVERTRANAALQAYGYRTQATNFAAQSQLDQAQAGFDQQAGLLKAFGGTLNGLSSIGSKWTALQNSPASYGPDDFGGGSAL